MIRRMTWIALVILCVFAVSAAGAEVTSEVTEANGRVTRIQWKDENGYPAAGPEGYATVRYAYKSGEVTETYFDAAGVTCQSAEGAYGKRISRDGKNRITQIEYLDPNGKRMLNRQGYGMMTISYYGFGEVRLISYYGMGKRLVKVPALGYAKVYNEYSYKTMTLREFQDVNGKPVDTAQGYATVRQKLNKKSQVMSIRYDRADGKPATGPDGWYRCRYERDDKGRITRIEYQDTSENLTDRGAGYAWEERCYEGDTALITRYDLSGNKVSVGGVVTVARKENEDGQVTEERYRDAEGQVAVNELGVAGVRYAYDPQGRVETVTYLDTEGKPGNCNKGYAGYRDTWDEDGVTVSRTYLGPDGLATEIAGGYSEVRYFYDETKFLTDTRYYDANGTQIRAE